MSPYEKATKGIRVRVEPYFSPAESSPAEGTFVFAYHVEVANEGDVAAQLLFRHWLIHDAAGDDTEVDGEGVVGLQPRLHPGESHSYQSFCVLRSPSGYMEGYYTFERAGGGRFRVDVPRFDFTASMLGGVEDGGGEVMN
jgi:ApaG protein